MGFVFHYISDATEPLHFIQPTRALKFYNFVCSIQEEHIARKNVLNDSKVDRDIISFYIRYHYLLSRKDTTASNALIGAWQRKLGHKILWENFNLVYEQGPTSLNGTRCTPPCPTQTSTRKSTGCISASEPVKPNPLPHQQPADWSYASDSSLTSLSSSDDEDDGSCVITKRPRTRSPSSGGRVALGSLTDLRVGSFNDCSFGGVDQGISDNSPSRKTHMDSRDEPPPTPPHDNGGLIGTSSTSPAKVVHGCADDPMNGTSISAECVRSKRGLTRPITASGHPKSLSAPILPPSSPVRRKRKKGTNYSATKKAPKQKKREPIGETTNEPMAIETPIIVHPKATPSESPSLNIVIRPFASIPSIGSEVRAPFSTSCTNVPPPRSASTPNPDPLLGNLKDSGETSAVVIPQFLRPTLPNNPPIWAQVRTFF